jgi:hypothetical protein
MEPVNRDWLTNIALVARFAVPIRDLPGSAHKAREETVNDYTAFPTTIPGDLIGRDRCNVSWRNAARCHALSQSSPGSAPGESQTDVLGRTNLLGGRQ